MNAHAAPADLNGGSNPGRKLLQNTRHRSIISLTILIIIGMIGRKTNSFHLKNLTIYPVII